MVDRATTKRYSKLDGVVFQETRLSAMRFYPSTHLNRDSGSPDEFAPLNQANRLAASGRRRSDDRPAGDP
jgi:hypothetical protein